MKAIKPELFIVIVCAILAVTFRWTGSDGERWKYIIDGDGEGHYVYLPAVFIYQDLSYGFFEKDKNISRYSGTFLNEVENRKVNKFFSGTALLLLPFFLTAFLVTWITGLPLDGYSLFFQLAVSTGSLFYLWLGLYCLRKWMSSFSDDKVLIGAVLFLMVFATNILFYAVMEPSKSHVFSFAAVSLFIMHTHNFFRAHSAKSLFLARFSLAAIALIRPSNLLILVLVPFLAGSLDSFRRGIAEAFRDKLQLAGGISVIFAVVSLQFLLYYFQTGNWIVWSYSDEGFRFLQPEILNVLFSYRKGLFVYTPVAMLGILGLISLARENRYRFVTMVLFLAVMIYIISSWWNWYYGDSFGLRAFIDFYGVFSLLLLFFLLSLKNRFVKIAAGVACLFFIFLNVFQTWQYTNLIIHPDSMNKEKYWYVFLKEGKQYSNIFGGGNEVPYRPLTEPTVIKTFNSMDTLPEGWGGGAAAQDPSGNNVGVMDSLNEFSVTFSSPVQVSGEKTFIKASLRRYECEPLACSDASFVVSLEKPGGENYFLYSFKLNDLPREDFGIWRKSEFSLILPKTRSGNDILKIYIWNPAKRSFYLDDIKIEVFKMQP